jgi:ribosomal protein L33
LAYTEIDMLGGVKMASKGAREHITLECTECHNRNYVTEKNKKNNAERLEIRKYCKFCKKTTVHKETK